MKRKYLSNRITRVAGKLALCMSIFLACSITVATAKEPLFKNEYAYRRYSVSDGLPENVCWDVFRDSKGYIWTSTLNGFCRYDGYHFSLFSEKEMNIMAVSEDGKGNIYGLSTSYYHIWNEKADTLQCIDNPKNWKLAYLAGFKTLPDNCFLYENFVEKRKAIFQLTDTGLVKRFENQYFEKLDNWHSIYWDQQNHCFYLPCKEGVYIVYESGKLQKHFPESVEILCIFSYKNGIWGLGTDGVYTFDPKEGFRRQYEITLTFNPAGVDVLSDREGRLLIRDEHHIYRYDGTRLETVFDKETVFDMVFDSENNLWVATYDGLYNLFGLQFKNYVPVKDNDMVRTLLVDKSNSLWAATYEGHLYRINHGQPLEENINRHSGVTYFMGFAAEQGNSLYFPGGEESAGILKWTNKKYNWLIPYPTSYHIALALPDGNLLFGSFQQVDICKPDGQILRTFSRDSLGLTVSYAVVDKKERIVIGGSTGIVIIDQDKIIRPEQPDNFLSCKNLFVDESGKIWAISGNSLFCLEDDSVKWEHTFTNRVRNVLVTRNNYIIVSTLNGINIKKNGDENFIFYGKDNGFAGEAMEIGIVEDADGNVWALSKKCMLRFNPNELLQKQIAPKMYINVTSFSHNNIEWKNSNDNQHAFRYNQNNICFSFIGLSYSSAENVRYRYRLLGFQSGWSEPTKQREVTFNNLPPGNYTFEIYADAGTDESLSETKMFSFTIQPAFWQTTWFLIFAILFLSSLSFLSSLIILQRKNRNLLEKLRTEKELNELKISSIRLKAIPHFNANVLAAIEYYIANRTKEEAMRILGIYSDFTLKTLSEVDLAARPLSEELAYVKMYLDLEKIRFMEKFDFHIHVEDEVDKSVQLPNMILHTYCENAVKHGLMPRKSGGLLTIRVSQRGQTVCVHVEDNGVGRAYAAQNPHLHSTKQGLSILNRQIEIYNRFNQEKIHQQVEDLVSAGKPSGTRFIIEVPLNFTYFS